MHQHFSSIVHPVDHRTLKLAGGNSGRDTFGNRLGGDAFPCVKSLSNELEQRPIEALSLRFTSQRIHGFIRSL